MAMMADEITERIHEALNELELLGIVISKTDDSVKLDMHKLNLYGYMLVFDMHQPVFITNSDFVFAYDINLYCSDEIPKSALKSYVMLKIKNVNVSP